MADYICIDGGTTNTRVRLVRNRQIMDMIQLGIGVTAANDDMAAFKNQLKEAIDALLARNALTASSITRILTSGMITSIWGCIRWRMDCFRQAFRNFTETPKKSCSPKSRPSPLCLSGG